MKTKSIPAVIMLTAGFVACIVGIVKKIEFFPFIKMLLLTLVIFYILGCIVKAVFDRNFKEEEQEETTEGTQDLEGEEADAEEADEKEPENNGNTEK